VIGSSLLCAQTSSEGWLLAFKALAKAPGQRLYHLAVQMDAAHCEVRPIRAIADAVMVSLRLVDEPTIVTVRNTIFPKSLIARVSSASELPAEYEKGRRSRQKLHTGNSKGRYFERLIALQRSDGQSFNQIAHTIEKLRDVKVARTRYEIDLTSAVSSGDEADDDAPEGVGVYNSVRDAGKPPRGGFPCMSHLAFQRDGNLVHAVAFYRSQDISQRAYGNYWGIGQLLQYVASEAGREAGTLTVLSGIATLGTSVRNASEFISRAKEVPS